MTNEEIPLPGSLKKGSRLAEFYTAIAQGYNTNPLLVNHLKLSRGNVFSHTNRLHKFGLIKNVNNVYTISLKEPETPHSIEDGTTIVTEIKAQLPTTMPQGKIAEIYQAIISGTREVTKLRERWPHVDNYLTLLKKGGYIESTERGKIKPTNKTSVEPSYPTSYIEPTSAIETTHTAEVDEPIKETYNCRVEEIKIRFVELENSLQVEMDKTTKMELAEICLKVDGNGNEGLDGIDPSTITGCWGSLYCPENDKSLVKWYLDSFRNKLLLIPGKTGDFLRTYLIKALCNPHTYDSQKGTYIPKNGDYRRGAVICDLIVAFQRDGNIPEEVLSALRILPPERDGTFYLLGRSLEWSRNPDWDGIKFFEAVANQETSEGAYGFMLEHDRYLKYNP